MNNPKRPLEDNSENQEPSLETDLPQNPPSTQIALPNSEKEETLLHLLSQQKKTLPAQSTLHSSVRGENASILMSKMGQLFSQERYQTLETFAKKDSEIWEYMRDSWLDRNVLRKQVALNPNDKNGIVALEKLKREAKITGVLEHPYIVPLHDMQPEKNGSAFFTLRKMNGERLSDFFQRKRQSSTPMEETFFLGIFLKVCDAIAYAHSRSIVHRSLVPSNLWIGSFGEVYVSDWGAAKYFQENAQPTEDIEALGKILRQGFLGIAPEEETEMLNSASERRKLKQLIRERIPFDLQWIIYKAIDEDWKKRYPNIQNFVADIERYQKNLRISSRKYTREEILSKWMQRNSRAIRVTLLLMLVVFLLLIYFQWLRREERKKTFQAARTQSKQYLSSAQEVTDQNKIISLRLRAFHQLRIALSIEADPIVERERFDLGKMILEQAYQHQDYALAQYMVQELGTSSFLSESEKERLAEEITVRQLAIKKEHLQKLEEWLRVLKNNRQTDVLRKEAFIEICKMKEEEVYQILKKHLEEGKIYFLSNSRNARLDEFYETITLILNQLEKPNLHTK